MISKKTLDKNNFSFKTIKHYGGDFGKGVTTLSNVAKKPE
jgi:hypothetical protein